MGLVIRIPVEDWEESAKLREAVVATEDDILNRIDDGDSTAEIARDYLVCREVGLADEEVIRPNKFLLNLGAAHDVSSIVRKVKRRARTKEDEEDVPVYIGKIGRQAEEGNSYVRYDDPEAIPRVEHYILHVIPGHVRNRLANYRDNGGDIRELVGRLKQVMDELVDRFEVED